MNLRNFRENEKYVHVFDGGNSDNLGLSSAFAVIDNVIEKYKKIILILVDSFSESGGVSDVVPDGRKLFDYVIDSNFMDSFDSLLSSNRESLVQDMIRNMNSRHTFQKKEVIFYHIKFDNVKGFNKNHNSEEELYPKLNSIKTDFKINDDEKHSIEKVTELFMKSENICLQKIKKILSEEKTEDSSDFYCTWPSIEEDKCRIDHALPKTE